MTNTAEKFYMNLATGSVDTLDGWFPHTEKDGLIEVIESKTEEGILCQEMKRWIEA